jgi:hypothetical protein
VTVSAPAPSTRNVPVVSVTASIDLRAPNDAQASPFKNVLDSLDAFETASDDNAPTEQSADSPPATTKANGAVGSKAPASKAAASNAPADPASPQRQPGASMVAASNRNLAQYQSLEQLVTVPAPVTVSAVPAAISAPASTTGKTAESQPVSTAAAEVVPDSTEPPSRGGNSDGDHLDSTLTENARGSVASSTQAGTDRILMPSTARFMASVQTPSAPAISGAGLAKSQATDFKTDVKSSSNIAAPALPAAPPASPVSSVSTSRTAEPAATAGSRSALQPEPAPEPALKVSSASRETQPKSTSLISSQGASPQRASSQAMTVSRATGGAVNPPAAGRLQAAVTPRNSTSSRSGAEAAPNEGNAATQAPSQPRPDLQAVPQFREPAAQFRQTRPQFSPPPAAASQPTAAPTPIAEPPAAPPVPAAPAQATPDRAAPVQAAPEQAAAVTATAASTRTAPPDSTPPDPLSSSSGGTEDQFDTPQQAGHGIASAAPRSLAHSTPIPAAVTESSAAMPERTTPETPEPSVTPRSEVPEAGVASGAPETPLAPTADNLAFAVRMLTPDNLPVPETKPSVTLSEPQVSQSKPAVTQPPSATAPEPPAQSQGSTSSARETPAPAPDSKTAGTRDAKAADLPQAGAAQPSGAHWSEVSAAAPSELSPAARLSEMVEPAHASPAAAAEETRVLVPELPKTSASSDILLHLTDNDQTSAAIRVVDRGGSVNVSVHASDPVLRESLRSNLGELSIQLNEQGWKAEALKPAAMAAPSDSQQDSHSGGQRSSQQQQSSGGDRPPQRDRRAQSGHWQQELEQQVSGGNAQSGGNG